MKKAIAILSISFFSTLAFAGGSGGGGVLAQQVSFVTPPIRSDFIFARMIDSSIAKVWTNDGQTFVVDLSSQPEGIDENFMTAVFRSLDSDAWVQVESRQPPLYLEL